MNIRLVDPATWTVVRKYRNVLEACAAPAGESEGLIWAEADDDAAAILQAKAKVGAATLREAAEGIAKPAPSMLERPAAGVADLAGALEQLRRFVAWERQREPTKLHVADWALGEIDRLRAEVEARRADAERLNWIQSIASQERGKVELARSILGTGFEVGEWPNMRVTVKAGDLRAAIDAARAEARTERKR